MAKGSRRSTQAQKKLSLIKDQLYGKEESLSPRSSEVKPTHLQGTYSFVAKDTTSTKIKNYVGTLDMDYLKQDLRKIGVLTILAIGAQIGLLLVMNNLS